MNEIVFDIDEENKNNASQKEITFDIEQYKSAIPQQEIIYDIEAKDSTSAQQDIIYDIDQEQGQVQKLSSEVPEISPRTFPLKEAVQAEEEGFFANLMSGLEVIDRPRAANVKAVEKFIDQSFDGNLNSGEIGEEWMKGIQGADHAMFGEYLNNKVNKVRANPKDYPIAAPIIETLDKILAIPDMAMDWYQTKTETDMLKFGTIMGLAICNGDKECEKRFIADKAIPAANTIKKRIEEREQEEISNNFAWVTGFLGDVALDPLSYFNKIVTVVKATGNAIKFIIPDKVINEISKKSGLAKEEVRKKTDALLKTRTGETLTDFTNRVWAVFSTKHELKRMGPEGSTAYDLMSKFKSLVAAARVKAVRDNKQFQERVKQYSVDTGVPVEDINRFITEAVERGGIGNINPNNISKESLELLSKNDEVRYEVWALSNKNKEQLKIELDAGIPIVKMKEQVLVHGGDETLLMDYLLRAVTPEAREAMLKQVGRKKYANSSAQIRHTSAYQRRDDWEGLTIVDINNLAKKGELPGYENQVFKKGFFHEDPAVIQALRDDKHYRSLAAMDLAEGLTAQFGFSGDDLIKLATDGGWQPSATVKKLTPKHALEYLKKTNPTEFGDLVITTNKFTDGHAMPSEIAKFVEDNLTFINNPNKVDEFLKGWDATTKWFKSWTLSLFPGYHERNIAGNMWNNFVSGVKLKSYKDALKVQRGIAIGEQGSIKLGNKTYTYNELRDLADNNGVTSRGLYAVDIEKSLIEEMGGAEKWMTLSSENKAIAYGKKVGEVIEDNARFANFLDGLTKGMTPEKAAKRVRHTLFDYGDLTKTEQQIFKRLFPFYTWTRKNIPFQIENIIKHPGKYKAIDTLRQEVEAAAGPEDKNEKYLADWMLANYPMKIRVNEDNQTEYFLLGGWFPGADVWKLASKPETVPKDLLHPLLKIGLEMYSASTNEQGLVTDLFSGKKLDPKQKTDYFFGTVPEDIKHYLNNLRVLNVLDGFVTGYRSDIGEYPKKLSPFTKEPKSLEEAWLTFLTGINKMKVDLEANKLFWQQSKQKQFQDTQTRFQQVIKKDRPVEERAAPIEEGKEILKQLEKGSKFAEGGEVTENTLAEDIQSSLGKRFENIKKASQYRKEGKQGPLYTSLQGVGQLAGGVYDIGAELVSHGASEVGDVLEENFPEAYQATAEKLTEAKNWVMNTDAGKYALDMAAKGYESYQEFKKNNPQDALTLESALNLGALTWGGKTIATVTEPKYRLAKQMQKDIDKSKAGYSSAQVASTFKPSPSTEDTKVLPYVGKNEPLKKYIEYVHVDDLDKMFKDYGANYKKSDWKDLKDSIKAEGGLNEPIIIDVNRMNKTAELSEGHHRLKVAKELGYEYLPVTVNMREGATYKHKRKDIIPSDDNSIFHPAYIGDEPNPNWRPDSGKPSLYFSNIRIAGQTSPNDYWSKRKKEVEEAGKQSKLSNGYQMTYWRSDGKYSDAVDDRNLPEESYDELYLGAQGRQTEDFILVDNGKVVNQVTTARRDDYLDEQTEYIIKDKKTGKEVGITKLIEQKIDGRRTITGLVSLKINNQNQGTGKKFIDNLKQASIADPYSVAPEFKIMDVKEHAKGFWDKVGAKAYYPSSELGGTYGIKSANGGRFTQDIPKGYKPKQVTKDYKGKVNTILNFGKPLTPEQNRLRKKILKLEKQEKQAERAKERELTKQDIKELGAQLSESDGFKYRLPAIIAEAATKDKIGNLEPDKWKYNISRWIKKNKVKQEEVDDTFLMDWLNEQDPNTKLSAKDIFNYVKDNSPQLKVYSNPLNEKKISGQDWLNKQPLTIEQRKLGSKVHDAYQNILIRNNNFESQAFLDLLGEQKAKDVKQALKNTKNFFDDGYLTFNYWLGNARRSDPAFEGLKNSPVFIQYTKDYVRDVEFELREGIDDTPATPKMVNDWISDYGLDYAMGKAFRQLQKSPPQERIKLFKKVAYHDIVKMLNDSSTTNAQKEAIKEVKDKIDNVFKTKLKLENFKDTNEKELNDLFKESEKIAASTVDDAMWSDYALRNMKGKPVTILVQAKVGAEDRLKRAEELSKTISKYESEQDSLFDYDDNWRSLVQNSKDEFEEVTGIPWDKRKETLERLKKETLDIYKEPHWTGNFNNQSALKAGLPEENIFMHIRGQTVEGKYLEGGHVADDSKGLFVLEQQAQPHQKAMANKAALENIQEFKPELRRTINATGYAKKGSRPEVERLMDERDAVETEVYNLSRKLELENRKGTEKEKQKISELNDKAAELHAEIVNLRGALSDSKDDSIPEVLSHKKDWTPLAMKQSLKYALDNNLNYLVLPIEKHSIKQIEQFPDDRDIINTIIDRNSVYSPRAYRDIVRKWDKDAKPIEDYYFTNNGIRDDDIHKVIILPITRKIKAGYKKDGLTAYRRGGLVTQMKALSLSA